MDILLSQCNFGMKSNSKILISKMSLDVMPKVHWIGTEYIAWKDDPTKT